MSTTKRRACDSCYRRKIQCDGAAPQCNWCEHHNLPCTFDRPIKSRRGAKSKSRSAENHHRSETGVPHPGLNGALQLSEGSSASPLSPPRELHSTSLAAFALGADQGRFLIGSMEVNTTGTGVFAQLHFAGAYLGEISSYSGIPFFSVEGQKWIQQRTGEVTAFPNLCASGPPWQILPHLRTSFLPSGVRHHPESMELPDRQFIEEYIGMFHSSPFKMMFPAIDSILFKAVIDLAYKDWKGETPSAESISAKACLFAFFSVISEIDADRKFATEVDGDACAVRAQYLLLQVLLESDVTRLQSVFMLGLHHLVKGELQTASLFHTLACRLLFMLGAHTQVDAQIEPTQIGAELDPAIRAKEHLRNLFWVCYTFDKDISLRTGQPPCIDDTYCDLTLPPRYLDMLYGDQYCVSPLGEPGIPGHPGDLRLTILKSKICSMLYSPSALRKSDAELLRDIRELDDELERWRMSLPRRHRPTLSSPDQASIDSAHERDRGMQMILITVEYHYLMAAIHRASGRCRAWMSHESGEMEGVSSSLALSVAASRSTLYYLRATVHAFFGQAFWVLVFYPMSAVLTIFCNILLNPMAPRSRDDLELLKNVPELIRSLQRRKLSPAEAVHMQMVDDFLGEVLRLGDCAIAKACQG